MIDQTATSADLARAITDARDRLVSFARQCPADRWADRVLEPSGDPRPLGVIVDHVGHAYEYLGQFIGDTVTGHPPAIDATVIDALNAEHAAESAAVTREVALDRLTRSGDALAAMVADLPAGQLDLAEGRVRRLASIAVWHADNHRTDLEEALAARG